LPITYGSIETQSVYEPLCVKLMEGYTYIADLRNFLKYKSRIFSWKIIWI